MVTAAIGTSSFYPDRWLLALISLLMSALVLAEQTDATFSYDDLMKDTIFGSSRNWRSEKTESEQSTTEPGWRAEQPAEVEEPFAGSGYVGASQKDRLRKPEAEESDSFIFHESNEQSNLFKIEI